MDRLLVLVGQGRREGRRLSSLSREIFGRGLLFHGVAEELAAVFLETTEAVSDLLAARSLAILLLLLLLRFGLLLFLVFLLRRAVEEVEDAGSEGDRHRIGLVFGRRWRQKLWGDRLLPGEGIEPEVAVFFQIDEAFDLDVLAGLLADKKNDMMFARRCRFRRGCGLGRGVGRRGRGGRGWRTLGRRRERGFGTKGLVGFDPEGLDGRDQPIPREGLEEGAKDGEDAFRRGRFFVDLVGGSGRRVWRNGRIGFGRRLSKEIGRSDRRAKVGEAEGLGLPEEGSPLLESFGKVGRRR